MNIILPSALCLLCLLIWTPHSLCHRDGARAEESCYGHEIVHNSVLDPVTPPKQLCLPPTCPYQLILAGEVNAEDLTQLVNTQVAITFALTCGSVYRCKLKPCLHGDINREGVAQITAHAVKKTLLHVWPILVTLFSLLQLIWTASPTTGTWFKQERPGMKLSRVAPT
jgi:hypothetical protein